MENPIEMPKVETKLILDANLPELSEEQFVEAKKAAGQNTEDVFAILLNDGTFTFRAGSQDLKSSVLTEDMVAMSYLGTGERRDSEEE